MKTYILLSLLIISVTSVSGQQRNLEFYLSQAQANSPLINKNRNENKIVELDLEQVNSILKKPEINFNSGVMFAPIISHDNNSSHFELVSAGATKYTGYDLALTDGGNYRAVVSVRQPLLAASKYKAYSGKATVSSQINENNIALTVHELEQVVGYQYLLCIKSKLQIENNIAILKVLDDQMRLMKKLVENAVYKQTDLMLLQIEVQNFEAELGLFNEEYMTSLYDLNLICGINDTARVELQDLNLVLKTEKTVNSNFLTSYRLDSLSIVAEQTISELKYKPQLDLFADAGLNAAYLPYLNRFGFSTGIALTWNIFDGHQRDIQRAKSDISLKTIEFEKKNFLTRNEIDKNKVLEQLRATDKRIILREQQAEKYKLLYETYSKELTLGDASVMDYKNLLKDIAAAKQEILLLKMEKQLLISTYNYLNY